MGEVFAAENIRTGRPVAVKLLRADSKSKSSAVERFRREARAAGSINSDHVTQVLDVEDDAEHGIVIVFELLEGESLIDRLKRTGPIPFEELHPIIDEVWVGLSDAHKVGIIHRDLKPSNVFLERRPDGQQRVKILDFGISKLPKEMGGETLTEMGQSLGTFSFMPPEQIGRAKTVDHRADIYATTTMIYQSLTGQLPYIARNILVMVEMKSKTDPRPLAEAIGHPIERSLEEFVAKGLARNPADRFQDALRALEEWRKLKDLHVPESRRVVSSFDLNAQARASGANFSSGASGPLPAAGRLPNGAYQPPPQTNTAPRPSLGVKPPSAAYPIASGVPGSGQLPPAPVVPAGMLEPVMSAAALPRLYDQTESTTDISHVESLAPEPSGVKSIQNNVGAQQAGSDPRGPEIRALTDNQMERKGPQGTRVMPPSIVQQAIAAANAAVAKKAELSGAQAAHQGQSANTQTPQSPVPAVRPQSSPHPPDLRGQQGSGGHPQANVGASLSPYPPPPGAPPPPTSSMSNAPQTSGQQPMMRSPTPDPRSLAGAAQQMVGGMPQHPPQQHAQQQHSSSAPGSPDMRMGSQPPQPGQGQQHSSSYPGQIVPRHPQLTTLRLTDEPSSIPVSQDKTTVYRPKKTEKKKSQSLVVFVIGALAFAIVGFGIVYMVQLLVRQIGQ